MAIFEQDCTAIEVEEGTVGGKTYYVKHAKWQDERAICFRPVKTIPGYEHRHGARCEREAGWNTSHQGQGACKTHGGSMVAKTPTTATRSTGLTKWMRHHVNQYLDVHKDALLDLSFELAAARSMFEQVVDSFPSPEDDEFPIFQARALNMINTIGNLVDRISKIEQRNTITANEVVYLRLVIADMFMKWIDDPSQRELALQELISRIPGGEMEQVLLEGK